MNEHWPEISLSQLATITMGQSPEAACVSTDERGLAFLQGCAEFGARVPSPKFHCSPPLRVAKAGSVLISVRAPVGRSNFADQDYCIGRGLGAVTAKPEAADNTFLLHAIEQNVGFLHRRSQGSTFLAIGSRELSALPVPALRLATQRRIAEILSTVDEAIEQTEALIAKYQQIKAGLMHDLFTRGVTPNGHLRPTRAQAPHLYRESPLGWIPKEWEVEALGKHIGRIDSGWSPNCAAEPAGPDEWGVLKTTAVVWDGYNPSENKRLPEDLKPMKSIETRQGDLLITRKGPVDRVGVVVYVDETPPRLMFPDTVFRTTLVEAKRLSAPFLARALGSLCVQRHWWQRKVGLADAQVNLNHGILKLTPIPIPERREQEAICYRITASEHLVEAVTDYLHKMQNQKHGLMHDLLTGHVRVKVAEAASA